MYSTRTTCRLCNGNLKDIISLGNIHLSTFLDTNDNPPAKIPLDLVECNECSLVQLRHTTDNSAMYSDYWYQSGLNGSMVRALNDVVEQVFKHVTLNHNDLVIDIGANDGTLLSFYPRYVHRLAIEPSNLWKLAVGKVDEIINDYFTKEVVVKQYSDTKAKVITAIAMFYDLEDPHKFVQDMKDILADDGIIVIQMMDLMSMVKYNDFPNICHEHLEYYSLEVFVNLMKEHGLEVFDIEYNGVNGGSMRAYIRHDTTKYDHGFPIVPLMDNAYMRVVEALETESKFFEDIGDIGTYFSNKVSEIKTKIVNIINELNADGELIGVMGASTKGNTILQYFGLTDRDIDHAAEVNPDKYGKRTVGSNIPIISQEESLKRHVDYYLILPWGFIENFIDRNMTYLVNGGAFIVPLPQPRIIRARPNGLIWIQIL